MLGDFNARVGKPDISDSDGRKLEYVDICDRTQNAPGKKLINLCKDKSLVIANHLKHSSRSGQYEAKKWISPATILNEPI